MSINEDNLKEKSLKQRIAIRLLSQLFWGYLRAIDVFTKRFIINYKPPTEPVIYAMWHGYQMGLGAFPEEDRANINVLVSQSNDGEIMARICHWLGFSLVRGSHGRNGEKALREMISETQNGKSIAFMVDGPKGPKQKVKKGIIRLAKMAQVPIVPIVPHLEKVSRFNSWDEYQIPKTLFCKFSMICGEPLYIPEEITPEQEKEYIKQLEDYMFELEKDVKIEHKAHDWRKKWQI